MAFSDQRREPLLDEQSFAWNASYTVDKLLPRLERELEDAPRRSVEHLSTRLRIANERFRHALRLFSAGAPLSEVAVWIRQAVEDFDRFASEVEDGTEWPAIDLAIPTRYVDALWLLSLTCLLGLGQQSAGDVASVYAADDSNDGADELFEVLLAKLGRESFEANGLIHEDPYQLLLDCLKSEPEDRPARMATFLKRWFKAQKECDWWGLHVNRTKDPVLKTGFFGYWAFEAALVTYLWDIDDSSYRDLPHYPKDLVDYARQNALRPSDGGLPSRVMGGEPCPRSGYWQTPARVGSRRRFDAGETIPKIGGDWGATIWQWDEQQ